MPTFQNSELNRSLKKSFNLKKNISKCLLVTALFFLIGYSVKLLAENNNIRKTEILFQNLNSVSVQNSSSSLVSIQAVSNVFKTAEAKKLPLPVIPQIKLPVLMYHHIDNLDNISQTDSIGIGLRVSPDALEKQLLYLKEQGYKTINSFQLYDYWKKGIELPEKPILLTFDDGYIDNYSKALPLLKKYNMVGDFAIITKVIATGEYMNYDQLKELIKAGNSISSHTQLHCSLAYKQKDGTFLETPLTKQFDPKDECPSLNYPSQLNNNQVKNELINSKKTLEENLGIKVTTLIYPFGHHNKQTMELAKEVGFEFGFTVMPQSNEDLDLSSPFDLPRYRANGQQDLTLRGFFAGGK